MHASECRRYADMCLRLADELHQTHREFLVDQATQWLRVAKLLDQEDRSGKMNGHAASGDDTGMA